MNPNHFIHALIVCALIYFAASLILTGLKVKGSRKLSALIDPTVAAALRGDVDRVKRYQAEGRSIKWAFHNVRAMHEMFSKTQIDIAQKIHDKKRSNDC